LLRRRIIVEGLHPEVDAGRFPIKRTVGEDVIVGADIFTDGHDKLAAALLYRRAGESSWRQAPMQPLGNDRWQAGFPVEAIGRYEYTVEGWIDRFGSWRHELSKKFGAGQDVTSELLEGAAIVREAFERAGDAANRKNLRRSPRRSATSPFRKRNAWRSPSPSPSKRRWPGMRTARRPPATAATCRSSSSASARDSPRGTRCFPRSSGSDPKKGGTFETPAALLPYVASLGVDVLYLPPIHPIGRSFRKGKNNTLEAGPEDVGSPWAIGAEAGGHDAVEPSLGTGRRLRPVCRGSRAPRHRDRTRSRLPGVARSSLREGASRVVQAAARRHDQVRREPAEEVSGHLPDQLRVERVGRALDGAEARHRVLDFARRQGVSRRQPRTPSRSSSGSGRSPTSSASIPTPSSSPKRSPGRR
jgi:starch synthase (maltosyl-transferring)